MARAITDILREVPARLIMTRNALGLSQAELCREAGIATNAWNQFEKDRTITIVNAIKLCDRFGLTLDWLYLGDRSGLPGRVLRNLSIESEPPPIAPVVARPPPTKSPKRRKALR